MPDKKQRGISNRPIAIQDVPDAPTVSAADVGTSRAYNNGAATVTLSNPTGGAPTSWSVTTTPTTTTTVATSSPVTLTGLSSATSYTVSATATNGTGVVSGATTSSSFTATTVPQNPTMGSPTVATGQSYTGTASVSVPFTAGATGGATVSGYTVTSSSGNTGTGASSPITVASETVGTARTYTVTATNANGTSTASSASAATTPSSVPQAPTIGTATAGNASASVTFTANATGGSSVTGYTVTSSPGSLTGTGASSPITVSGLTNGTAYTFTVTATNSNGTSAASSASGSVTPVSPYWIGYINSKIISGDINYSGNPVCFSTDGTLTVLNTDGSISTQNVMAGSFTPKLGATYGSAIAGAYRQTAENYILLGTASGYTRGASRVSTSTVYATKGSTGTAHTEFGVTVSNGLNAVSYGRYYNGSVYQPYYTYLGSTISLTSNQYITGGGGAGASTFGSIGGKSNTAGYFYASTWETTSSGNRAGFYSLASGGSNWTKYVTNGTQSYNTFGYAAAGDPSSLNSYFTTKLDGTGRLSGIYSFDNSGTLRWSRQITLDVNGGTTGHRFYDATVDSNGNVYFAGTANNGYNGTIIKYNSSGTLQWVRNFTGVDQQAQSWCRIEATGTDLYVWAGASAGAGQTDSSVMRYPQDGSITGTYVYAGSTLNIDSYSATESSLTANLTAGGTVTAVTDTYSSMTNPTISSASNSITKISL